MTFLFSVKGSLFIWAPPSASLSWKLLSRPSRGRQAAFFGQPMDIDGRASARRRRRVASGWSRRGSKGNAIIGVNVSRTSMFLEIWMNWALKLNDSSQDGHFVYLPGGSLENDLIMLQLIDWLNDPSRHWAVRNIGKTIKILRSSQGGESFWLAEPQRLLKQRG